MEVSFSPRSTASPPPGSNSRGGAACIYTTKVTAVGGRSGNIKSEDGILDLPLAMPKELGGKGGATNPEQLFAAGYAACFENAVIHVSRAMVDKVRDNDIEGSVAKIGGSQR